MKVFQKSLISQVLCDPLLLIPHSCCFVATITVKKGLLRAYKHWVCSHASMAEYMLLPTVNMEAQNIYGSNRAV